MLPKAFLRSCTHTYTKIKLKFTNTHRQNHIHTKKEKHTKIQDIIYKQKQFQIDVSQRQSQLCYMGSELSDIRNQAKHVIITGKSFSYLFSSCSVCT